MLLAVYRSSLFLSFFLLVSTQSFSQTSEEGVWLPTYGDLNVLVVYAEAINDPKYNDHPSDEWLPGEMPKEPHKYFDGIASDYHNRYVTDFFHTASFGKFKMKGQYWPELIQVDYAKAAFTNLNAIISALNNSKEKANGLVDGLSALDKWTTKNNFEPKINQSDSLFDMVVVLWRVNSHISAQNNSGYCAMNNQYVTVLDRKGINCFSEFQSWDNEAYIVLRHELSHAMYGGNNFHTGGAGAGLRTFIPSVGGYSVLSSWDAHSMGFNGWDRNRLGWKNPDKKFLTSAFKKTTNALVEHAFEQNKPQQFINGKYFIRDFVTSGDAIALRLPGPDSPRLHQYLWLEYHIDTGRFDYADTTRHGVYAYVQVGKDNKKNVYSNGTTSPGNYTYPLPASGRWDFEYYKDTTINKAVIKKDSSKSNPISGNHFLMRPMIDGNSDGALDKLFLPEVLTDNNHQAVERYVTFGNSDDAFKPTSQAHINLSTNPSTNTLITHNAPNHRKNNFDSDTSFITGLDINIRDTTVNINSVSERCALVDVKWNRFNITDNVRWCGTIALKQFTATTKPKLTVDSGCVLLLDRSLTPMHEKVNTRDTLNGQLYFSPLTTFTLYKGTQLVLKKGATLKLMNGSILYVRKGANIIFEEGSKLEAKNGQIIYLD